MTKDTTDFCYCCNKSVSREADYRDEEDTKNLEYY